MPLAAPSCCAVLCCAVLCCVSGAPAARFGGPRALVAPLRRLVWGPLESSIALRGAASVRRQARPRASISSMRAQRATPRAPPWPQVEGLKKQRRVAVTELLNKRHGRMGKGAAGGGGGDGANTGDGGGDEAGAPGLSS
jgi:hypothetical protein